MQAENWSVIRYVFTKVTRTEMKNLYGKLVIERAHKLQQQAEKKTETKQTNLPIKLEEITQKILAKEGRLEK